MKSYLRKHAKFDYWYGTLKSLPSAIERRANRKFIKNPKCRSEFPIPVFTSRSNENRRFINEELKLAEII